MAGYGDKDSLADEPKAGGYAPGDVAADGPPAPKSGLIRRGIGDTALAVGQGAVGAIKSITDTTGAGTRVSKTLGDIGEGMQGLMSPERQAEMTARQAKVKEADQSGSTFDQVTSRLGGFAEAPVQTLAQGIGSLVPTVAAAIATRGKSLPVQLAPQLGIGTTMGVGGIKGQNYDAVLNEALQQGKSPAEAEALAQGAAEYSAKNAPQQAIGGALGALAATTGVERFFGGGVKATADGIGKRVLKAGAAEGLPEGAQGAQGQYAQNVALNDAGFQTDNSTGVLGEGLLQGLVGGVLGGATGIPGQRKPRSIDQSTGQPAPGEAGFGAAAEIPQIGAQGDLPPTLSENPTNAELDRISAKFPTPGDAIRATAPPVTGPLTGGLAALAETQAQAVDAATGPTQGLRTPDQNAQDGAREIELDRFKFQNASGADTLSQGVLDSGFDASELTLEEAAALMGTPAPGKASSIPTGEATEIPLEVAEGVAPAAPEFNRTPRTAKPQPAREMTDADVVRAYVEQRRTEGTLAGRRFAGDFDAGRITPADVLALVRPRSAAPTPDERLAAAAAQAPAASRADGLVAADGKPIPQSTRKATDAANPAGNGVPGNDLARRGDGSERLRQQRPGSLDDDARPADEQAVGGMGAAGVRAAGDAAPGNALSAPSTLKERRARAQESDQDRSNREWRENFDRVVNAPDLNAISTKDIDRAINYADSRSQYEKRKGWDGSPTNDGVIEGLDREIENLKYALKQRQPAEADAQPATTPARTETPAPPAATATDAAAARARSASVEADGLSASTALLEKLAAGFGHKGGFSTMPEGLGKTARKLGDAIMARDAASMADILDPSNKRSRAAFESLFSGKVKLPTTIKGTRAVVEDFLSKVSAGINSAGPVAAAPAQADGLKPGAVDAMLGLKDAPGDATDTLKRAGFKRNASARGIGEWKKNDPSGRTFEVLPMGGRYIASVAETGRKTGGRDIASGNSLDDVLRKADAEFPGKFLPATSQAQADVSQEGEKTNTSAERVQETPKSEQVAPLGMSKDGITGREVSWGAVPNGNDAFQYAIGKTEEDGREAIYRRRADERGTYGGWRWEADAPKGAKPDAPASKGGVQSAPTPAPDPFADNYAALDGKTITQQVLVADTGKTATLRMDAGQALRDVNEREQALLKLKACIGR